ncbi:unnamed protein product [Durusdinium trenchii]|uniref:Uncharacterized protein n=1 Tax=Durusdinium trenchii TaxID=1381693 RepID=A0ABP0JH77_9DINO
MQSPLTLTYKVDCWSFTYAGSSANFSGHRVKLMAGPGWRCSLRLLRPWHTRLSRLSMGLAGPRRQTWVIE